MESMNDTQDPLQALKEAAEKQPASSTPQSETPPADPEADHAEKLADIQKMQAQSDVESAKAAQQLSQEIQAIASAQPAETAPVSSEAPPMPAETKDPTVPQLGHTKI